MSLSPGKRVYRYTSLALAFGSLFASAAMLSSCGKPKKMVWIPPEQRQQKLLPAEEQFRAARLLLMDGRTEDAAKMFRELEVRPNLAQPMQNWITLFAGLSELQAGHEDKARPIFEKLAKRGPFVKEGPDLKLAHFFVDLGQRLSDTAPIPSGVGSKYDKFSYEAIALFLFAQQSESTENFDDALDFYRQFTTAGTPRAQEPFPGFNVYFNYAKNLSIGLLDYEDEISTGERAMKGKGDPLTPTQKQKIVNTARAARIKVKQSTKLIADLDGKLKHIAGEVGEQVKMSQEDAAEDAKVLPDAKEKWQKALENYAFIDAKRALTEVSLRGLDAKAEQERLITRTSFLENFKFYLIQELAVAGYPDAIELKDGKSIKGTIKRMDDKSIQIDVKGTMTTVPWGDIKPESVFAMAKYLVTPDEAADAQGFRKWHLGNFAGYIGKKEEAKALLAEAVKLNPAYQSDLPIAMEWVQ